MRKILLVSPYFAPLIYPDLHRIRMMLPYLPLHGWEPLVLSLDPHTHPGIKDEWLTQTIPQDIKAHFATFTPWQSRLIPSRPWRAIGILAHAGNQIIEQEKPDLIYFSTTMFPVMSLGPYWLKRYGIPYLVDWQDPWVSDYYSRTNTKPPGGYLKYGISQLLGRYLEPEVLRHASHIITVSPSYPLMLQSRYPWLNNQQFTVLPFGGTSYDFEILRNLPIRNPIFAPDDGYTHWVYLGRFIQSMHYALASLFAAIQQHRQNYPQQWSKIKLHFIGTHYDINATDSPIQNLANTYNLNDMVNEYPQRIPYLSVLKTMTDSDGLIILGSDDQGYTPSKLYPCILANRAIFALMHQNSSIVHIIKETNSGHVITFSDQQNTDATINEIKQHLPWFLLQSKSNLINTNWDKFEPYTAKSLTQKHTEIFDKYV
ncbi:MAG: hypothetical protein WCO45_11685 [Pseudanabaena sp. ELA607]